jgi:hypothetical protein
MAGAFMASPIEAIKHLFSGYAVACERLLQANRCKLSTGVFDMSLSLVCEKCKEPVVFAGAVIELVGESRIGYRHRCGAMNELDYVSTDEGGRAIFRVVGVVKERRAVSAAV